MLRVLELFSGIGAQAAALEKLGVEFESTCCEIDEKAHRSYCAIHGETPNIGDITKVEHIPDCDLVTWSFPCQALSVAGKQTGMVEGSGTTSSLAWEVMRLLSDAKERDALPKWLVMENVPAVLNKRNSAEFARLRKKLEELGYTNSYKVLNAKDFGIPQNRNRCFMVSCLDGREFVFPDPRPTDARLKDLLESDVPESYYLSDERIAKYEAHRERHAANGHGFGWSPNGKDGVSNTVTTHPSKDSTNTIIISGSLNHGYDMADRVYSAEGLSPTVTTQSGGGHIPRIEYPAGTAKGYMTAEEGDGLVMERPTLARGTVQPQSSPTLSTGKGCGSGVVVAGELGGSDFVAAKTVFSPEGVAPTLTTVHPGIGMFKVDVTERLPDIPEGEYAPMLTPGRIEKRQNGRRFKEAGEDSFTVTTIDKHGVAYRDHGELRIRYLTERECWRLMGFNDEQIDRAFAVTKSKTQRYKQAGNSIVVDCLEAIFRELLEPTKRGPRTLNDWL